MPKNLVDLTQSSSPPSTHRESTSRSRLERLRDAIHTAQPARLRATLMVACSRSQQAADVVEECLMIPKEERSNRKRVKAKTSDEESETSDDEESRSTSENDDEEESEEEDSEENDNNPIIEKATKKKRMVPRYAICENCNEEFDVTENGKEACAWHENQLEIDYDADTWIDWDEGPHGPMDREDNRVNYPEGFKHECCGGDGTTEGCQVGPHVESKSITKRSRR